MTWNGWAVTLNGVTLSRCTTQADWDELACYPTEVIDALDGPPDGLGLPGLRDEDVTYYQRDGVKHFSDWYLPRLVTVTGTIAPGEDCEAGDCSTVRQQLQDVVQAWKRGCCDTELVIWPDCYAKDLLTGLNVYPDGTFDVNTDGWAATGGTTVARVTSPVHAGAGALQVTWPTLGGGLSKAAGPVYMGTPGDRVQVSAWLYADVGEPAPMLGCSDVAGDGAVFSDPIPADGSWYYTELAYLIPATGEVVPFVTSSTATVSGDVGFVDEVELKLFNPAVNRDLNGPFGVVGRPRVFQYQWADYDRQIVEFTARFDAVDHRMYVLDECGTPGFETCETIEPGAQLFSLCLSDGLCFTGAGVCFTNEVGSPESVAPTSVSVGGTEKVNPTITLYAPLIQPTVENITTGEFVQLDMTLEEGDSPVTINTEDGTAFDADGNSLTHLLRGSLFLSMFPGNYEWRLISNGVQASFDTPGYMTLCFRSTIVAA